VDFFQHFQSWNLPFPGFKFEAPRNTFVNTFVDSLGRLRTHFYCRRSWGSPQCWYIRKINLKIGRLTKTALNLATSFFSIWESTSYLLIYAWWSPTNFLVWMRNSSSLGFGSWRVLKAALWNRLGRESADNKISTLVFSSKFYQNPKAMLQNRIFFTYFLLDAANFLGGKKRHLPSSNSTSNKENRWETTAPSST